MTPRPFLHPTGGAGSPTVTIDTYADLARAIVLHQMAGVIGMTHLLRARMRDEIALWNLLPSSTTAEFKRFAGATRSKPTVFVVGDDDGLDRGPAGWTQARRAVRWAASVMVHGAGAEIAHYEAVVQTAQTRRRMLLVEASAVTLPAWYELVAAAPHRPAALMIVARDGVHPAPVGREAMQ